MRLAGVHIEEELPERPFKARETFFQNDKTRTGQLRRSLKIHLAKRFAEFEMLLGRKRRNRA